MNKNLDINSFCTVIKRLEATNDIHGAYKLCLQNLTNPSCMEQALTKARQLAKSHAFQIFERHNGYYTIETNCILDENFLLDLAIELGYKDMERSIISTGWFSSIPCILIEGILSRHKYGLKINKEKQTSTIYYHANSFCDDYKMIMALSEKLIEMYSAIRQ